MSGYETSVKIIFIQNKFITTLFLIKMYYVVGIMGYSIDSICYRGLFLFKPGDVQILTILTKLYIIKLRRIEALVSSLSFDHSSSSITAIRTGNSHIKIELNSWIKLDRMIFGQDIE